MLKLPLKPLKFKKIKIKRKKANVGTFTIPLRHVSSYAATAHISATAAVKHIGGKKYTTAINIAAATTADIIRVSISKSPQISCFFFDIL